MKCPECSNGSHVLETRQDDLNFWVRRLRECLRCRHRWYTIEIEEARVA